MSAILTSSCRCHFCGGRMNVGDTFAWFEKSATRASRYHTIPAKWVRTHAHNCLAEERQREAAQREAETQAFVEKLTELMTSGKQDEAMRLVRGAA